MIKAALIVVSILLLAACSDRPKHVVVESQSMKIYHVESRHPISGDYQHRYEYWAEDESKRGWVLISDKKLDLGDEIKIVKVSK